MKRKIIGRSSYVFRLSFLACFPLLRRHSLKTMLSWAVQRDIFYTEVSRGEHPP